MKNYKMGMQKKIILFLFLLILLCNSLSSVTWADTTEDYSIVLAETASQIQLLDSNPGLNSSWNIIGLVRCNAAVPQDYYNTFYQNVLKGLSDCGGQLTTTRYTEYSKLILSVTAIGKDAQNVGGYNLLSYLSNYDHVSKQGINGAIWALIAVNAKSTYDFPSEKGVAVQTTRTLLVDKILATELKTGGFTLYGSEPDADLTAMAVQALAPYYSSRADVKAAVDRAIVILSSKQNNTGDYQSGGISNAESTAQVLIALSALSIDAATDSRFVKGSESVLTGLRSYYLGSGSFSHINGGNSNALATEQSFYALAAYDCFQKGGKLYDMEDIPPNPDIEDTESTEKQTEATTEKATDTTAATETETERDTAAGASTEVETAAKEAVSDNTYDQAAIQNPVIEGQNKVSTVTSSNQKVSSRPDGSSRSMVISKDIFEGLQGKDTNYKIDGQTADGVAYSWTFHGTDIKSPMDFDGTIVIGGDYESQINELSDAPFIFTVTQQEFPGEALLELATNLADGSYGLFSYNSKTQTATLLQKVEVKSGQTRCVLANGGNYYIAAKSKATLATEQDSVTEIQKVGKAGESEGSLATTENTNIDDAESKLIIGKALFLTMVMAIMTGLFAFEVNKVPESTDKEIQKHEKEQHEKEQEEK